MDHPTRDKSLAVKGKSAQLVPYRPTETPGEPPRLIAHAVDGELALSRFVPLTSDLPVVARSHKSATGKARSGQQITVTTVHALSWANTPEHAQPEGQIVTPVTP